MQLQSLVEETGLKCRFVPHSLVMKEEASDFLELETIKNLVRKYSQFINFPIYVWSSKVRVTATVYYITCTDMHAVCGYQ